MHPDVSTITSSDAEPDRFADPDTASPSGPGERPGSARRVTGDLTCYAGAVLVGAVLIVVAAVKQPFSYDELQQIAPYGSDSLSTITGATRQPPIDPLLGALFHHLFGEGQLQDRLVPVLAGIGSLVMMSMILRRFGLRYAGAFAVLVMATAPLMVRYSSYTRPYALPMFVMLVMTFTVQRWLDTGRRGWLVGTAMAAVALPLIRVPEPVVFLLVTAGVLAWYARRGRLQRSQAIPVILIAVIALAAVGIAQYLSLASSANGYFDPSPSGFVRRFPDGVHELVTAFVPLLGDSFPWWPLTLLVLVAVVAIPQVRRTLAGWVMWWPLLAAPIAFAMAYHFVNRYPFDALPYRARAASFFVPALVLAVAALASLVERDGVDRRLKLAVGVLLGAAFVGQLPATADVVRYDAAPDFGVISDVLTSQVPDDAIVLYDRPTPPPESRQPFLGDWRYMGDKPPVLTVSHIPKDVDSVPTSGPVYLLFNGQCAYPGRCVPGSRTAVDVDIPGWKIVYQHERFTLYAPTNGQSGRAGVVQALLSSGRAMGDELGYLQTYVAASLLESEGDTDRAKALVDDLEARLTSDQRERVQHDDDMYSIDPFGSD